MHHYRWLCNISIGNPLTIFQNWVPKRAWGQVHQNKIYSGSTEETVSWIVHICSACKRLHQSGWTLRLLCPNVEAPETTLSISQGTKSHLQYELCHFPTDFIKIATSFAWIFSSCISVLILSTGIDTRNKLASCNVIMAGLRLKFVTLKIRAANAQWTELQVRSPTDDP